MTRDLKALIRLRKWEVDEKRRALGRLLEIEAQILDAIARHEREVEAEFDMASRDALGAGRTFGGYVTRANEKRANLEKSLAHLRREIEVAQDAVAEAFKDFKTFEIAQENREEQERREQGRKEQIVLDEIGVELFRRGKGTR